MIRKFLGAAFALLAIAVIFQLARNSLPLDDWRGHSPTDDVPSVDSEAAG